MPCIQVIHAQPFTAGCRARLPHLLVIPSPTGYLAAVFLCLPDDVLPRIDPVQLLIQGVIIDGSNVSETVDREYDVRTLLLIYHHAINCVLLTEQ